MESGLLIVDKEKGVTSRDVVNSICKRFSTKKVGHAGTLDPLASGVLVVAVNDATRALEFLTMDEKEYIAEVIVGMETDTLDVTGAILRQEKKEISKEQLETVLTSFLGTYEQEVPKFSAVHVNGKRLYEYARAQEEVTLPKRAVTISSISLLECHQEEEYFVFSFQTTVSKGTYIRSLIRDIGLLLKVPCTMRSLRRTRQGKFDLSQSKRVEDLERAALLPIADALSFPQVVVEDEHLLFQIKNGAKLPYMTFSGLVSFVDPNHQLLAIYQPDSKGGVKPVRVWSYQK